jgi:hypothetical protein
MNVVVNIEGRDALPAWVIPFVIVRRELSPDKLVDLLLQEDPHYECYEPFPRAFNLDACDRPTLIPPHAWGETKDLLIKLDRELGHMVKDFKTWGVTSIDIIKDFGSRYIWIDEFQKWFDWYRCFQGLIQPELYLTPTLSAEHEQYFKETESRFLKTKAPLDKIDKGLQDARIIENGAPTISLRSFIDRLLVEATGDSATLPTFYRLVEEGGLVVYDGVLGKRHDYIRHESYDTKPKIVSQEELLGALRKREQQATYLSDDDSFEFWGALAKESKYSVCRDNVAMAYRRTGKSQFPWLRFDDTLVLLNTEKYINADFLEKWQQKFGRPYETPQRDAEYEAEFIILTSKATSYTQIADDILNESLCEPLEHEDRVRLFVWRSMLESEKDKVNKGDWSIERDKRLAKIKTKISEINQLLSDGFGKIEASKDITEAREDDGADNQDSTYKQRVSSFNDWLKSRGIDHAKLVTVKPFLDGFGSVEDIFEELKKARKGDINKYKKAKGKGKPLWEISFATFNSKDFWLKYCGDVGYKRKDRSEKRQ